jgi:hypothetical protein
MTTKKATKSMFKKKHPEITLDIERRFVSVDLAENFVCGGVEDQFEYACQLTTRSLTSEGFVTEVKAFIDQVELEYSPSRGKRKASCEELAMGIINVAHGMMKSRLTQMYVVVTNLTGSVVAEWKKGEAVPPFPRLATRAESQTSKRSRSSC